MLRLEKLSDKNKQWYQQAIQVYEYSFPYEERRDAKEQERVMARDDYHFAMLLEEDESKKEKRFVGIMLFWEREEEIFLEHFAVSREMRNGGYGSKALKLLKEKGKKVILEIEVPVDELTKRRQRFYERNGFLINPHYHIQPKYHLGDDDLELKIMSTPKVLSLEEYSDFYKYIIRAASARLE